MAYWGVFTKRLSLVDVAFQPLGTTSASDLVPLRIETRPEIILETVEYKITVFDEEATVVDARRLPWSKAVHGRYFAGVPWSEQFDAGVFLPSSADPDARRWVYFDKNYHIQRLAPHRAIKELMSLVYQRHFETLVYEGPGVEPLQLARLMGVPPVHPLVLDAAILRHLTEYTKLHGKVWLSQATVPFFSNDCPAWKSKVLSLVERGHILLGPAGIGLRWLVRKYDEIMGKMDPGTTFVFKAGTPHRELESGLTGVVEVDPTLPVDVFVSSGVPCASMVSRVEGVPGKGVGRLEPTHTCTGRREALVQLAKIWAALPPGKTAICLSTDGDECPRRKYAQCTSRVLEDWEGYSKGQVVLAGGIPGNFAMYRVTTQAGASADVSRSTLSTKIAPCSRMRFDELHNLSPGSNNGLLVAVVTRATRAAWVNEMHRYKAGGSEVVVVFYGA